MISHANPRLLGQRESANRQAVANTVSAMTRFRRRSALYCPASNTRALEKARGLDADGIIVDLEDAVAPPAKAAAREAAARWLQGKLALERVLRVNGIGTGWFEADVAMAAAAAPDAVLLPKVSAPEDIWHLRRLLVVNRAPPGVALWAMIETPAGVLNAAAIAATLGPGGALVMGLNDLARETGTAQVPGRLPMLAWLSTAVLAARAAGASILDGVFADLADAEGLAAECRQGRDLGFDGKSLIHPAQIAPAHAAFSPSAAELLEARAIVAAFARPENRDRGVIALGGRMVERLHLAMAERTLARAGGEPA
jgi:citrate lyase subunit beta/citryl-CoA lyase